MLRSTAAALAAASLLASCSKDSKPDVPLENAAEACAAFQGFVSGYLARCMGFTEAVAEGYVAADPGVECAAWTAAVAAGTTTYDRAKATVCVAGLQALTCNQVSWGDATGTPVFPYECAETMRGSLPGAASCTHGFQCASGKCDLPTACNAPGTCLDLPGESEDCLGSDPPCADGLVCDAGTTTCERPDPVPAPVAVGEDCSAAPCVDAAFCRTSDDRCVARPTDGMACSAANPCAFDNRCVGNICQKLVQPGAACVFGENECVGGANCVAISTMAPGTTCQAWGRVGSRCGTAIDLVTFDFEVVGCVDSWCDIPTGVQGTCVAWTPVGEACEAGTGECGPDNGYRCDGTLHCERLYCDPTP